MSVAQQPAPDALFALLFGDVCRGWEQENAPGEWAADHACQEVTQMRFNVLECVLYAEIRVGAGFEAISLDSIEDGDDVFSQILFDGEGHVVGAKVSDLGQMTMHFFHI